MRDTRVTDAAGFIPIDCQVIKFDGSHAIGNNVVLKTDLPGTRKTKCGKIGKVVAVDVYIRHPIRIFHQKARL